MEELQLIVDAIEKGIKHNIYSKVEIYGIQKLLNELEIKLAEKNEDKDNQTE